MMQAPSHLDQAHIIGTIADAFHDGLLVTRTEIALHLQGACTYDAGPPSHLDHAHVIGTIANA